MDVRFINPFIVAIKNVFSTMLTTEIIVSKPVIAPSDERTADVSAVIGLSGDAIGSVVLSFPLATAVKASHQDFSDALGELANMIAGSAKSKMDGLMISISLPSVVIGRHDVFQPRQAPRLALPCDSVLGRFCVDVVMMVQKKDANTATRAIAPAAMVEGFAVFAFVFALVLAAALPA